MIFFLLLYVRKACFGERKHWSVISEGLSQGRKGLKDSFLYLLRENMNVVGQNFNCRPGGNDRAIDFDFR